MWRCFRSRQPHPGSEGREGGGLRAEESFSKLFIESNNGGRMHMSGGRSLSYFSGAIILSGSHLLFLHILSPSVTSASV